MFFRRQVFVILKKKKMAAFPLQLFLICLKTADLQKDSFLPSLPSTSYTPVPCYWDDKLVRVCYLFPTST